MRRAKNSEYIYPCPKLENTLSELNRVMKYLLSPSDYLKFTNSLEDFRDNAGPQLQARFEQIVNSSSTENWATERFMKTLLQLREPIPLSTNFALLLKRDHSERKQLERAATLLAATAMLKQKPQLIKELRKTRLGVQINRSLSTTRIPGDQTDELVKIHDSTHIIVLCKGMAFRVDILSSDYEPLPITVIFQQLQKIVDYCKNLSCPENMLGVLGFSALPRTQWAQLRSDIKSRSEESSDVIECAENAILVLCLEDEASPVCPAERLEIVRLGNKIGNRYYDKPINIVVFSDGNAGVLFEHTGIDGLAAFLFCDALFLLADQKSFVCDALPNHNGTDIPCLPLNIILKIDEKAPFFPSGNLKNNQAVNYFQVPLQSDALNALEQTGMLLPCVAFSVQMTLYQHQEELKSEKRNRKPLIVMPHSVGHFVNGRTDPVYIGSTEVEALIKAIIDNTTSFDTLVEFFERAVTTYKHLVTSTLKGKAFGPHIAALRSLAENIEPTATIVDYLQLFRVPDVILTGIFKESFVTASLGNLYASEQLVINFVRSDETIDFTLASTGNLSNCLDKFSERIKANLQIMGMLGVGAAMSLLMIPKEESHSKPAIEPPSQDFTIAIHGGAGELPPALPHECQLVEFCLQLALTRASRILQCGGSALDGVEAAVKALETCFLFNAGKGSVFNSCGEHELEAAIIDGASRNCGAVACVREIKHPVQAARLVMDKSPYYLLTGTEALRFCMDAGLQRVDNTYFSTTLRKQIIDNMQPIGTVGAVAIDRYGKLAVATSTGGLSGKPPGRIGDSVMVGTGLYADNSYAIACTGTGEIFIKYMTASTIAAKAKSLSQEEKSDKKDKLQTACNEIILGTLKDEGVAGAIAVSADGEVAISFNCGVMFAGIADAKGSVLAKVMTSENSLVQPLNTTNAPLDPSLKPIAEIGASSCPWKPEAELLLWSQDCCSVFVDPYPVTPGVLLLCPSIPDHANPSGIFGLDDQSFVNVLKQARLAATVQKDKLGASRSALLCEGVLGTQGEYGKVIPLYGLPEQWAPIEAFGNYVLIDKGTVDTKEGPRLTNKELDELQARVLKHNPEAGAIGNNTFFGDLSDDNIFARIVRGEERAWRIWEDGGHLAFLTPFANTPGFTVVVPRVPLDSNVLVLPEDQFFDLMRAARKVAALLTCALNAAGCAIAIEGMGVNYCHVKLIPLHSTSVTDARKLRMSPKMTTFQEDWPEGGKYQGYITSALGSRMSGIELARLLRSLKPGVLYPPRSWRFPDTHAITAIKSQWYKDIFQIQNAFYHATVEYFHRKVGFSFVLTPITTETLSSPMGLGSDSLPVAIELFGEKVFLADSMQFVLEYFLRLQDGLPGTYYISTSFRGEDSDSTHLNQFYHVECELLGGIDSAIAIAEGYLLELCQTFLLSKELLHKIKQIAGTDQHLYQMIKKLQLDNGKRRKLPVVKMDQAVALLETGKYGPIHELVKEVKQGESVLFKKITRAGELALITEYDGAVWLTEMDHLSVPFYQAYTSNSKEKARCADLLMGLGETIGLGERHMTVSEVNEALNHHLVPVNSYKWYMDMRKNTPLQTSGWGMGSERFLCWLLQHDDVRDMHIIPRLKGHKFMP